MITLQNEYNPDLEWFTSYTKSSDWSLHNHDQWFVKSIVLTRLGIEVIEEWKMNALQIHGNQGVKGNIKKSSQPRELTNHGKNVALIFLYGLHLCIINEFSIYVNCKKRSMIYTIVSLQNRHMKKYFKERLKYIYRFILIHNTLEKRSCPGWGSNSRPSDYETDALPTALPRHR